MSKRKAKGTADDPVVIEMPSAENLERIIGKKAVDEKLNAHEAVPGVVIRKIVVDEHTAYIEYDETLVDFNKLGITRSSLALMHPDFVEAITALKPHLAHACDLKEAHNLDIIDVESPALMFIGITGLTIKGEVGGDKEGVKLQGTKLVRGKEMKLDAPPVLMHYSGEQYPFLDDLRHAVERVIEEAKEYMRGKCAEKQMSMDFADME